MTKYAPDDIVVRTATATDDPFLSAVTERLASFPLPPWRSTRDIVESDLRTVRRALSGDSSNQCVLLAEHCNGQPLGFCLVEEATDYFTGRRLAHIGVLAVEKIAEGHGVAAALTLAAERWANQQNLAPITLNVFAANARARTFYEKMGYKAEIVKYLKPLSSVV